MSARNTALSACASTAADAAVSAISIVAVNAAAVLVKLNMGITNSFATQISMSLSVRVRLFFSALQAMPSSGYSAMAHAAGQCAVITEPVKAPASAAGKCPVLLENHAAATAAAPKGARPFSPAQAKSIETRK